MFEMMHPGLWLALAGLMACISAAAGMLVSESGRMRQRARIERALSGGIYQSKQPRMRDMSQGALAHALGRLRALILRGGEQFAALMGGEAQLTETDLASAGFRGREAVLIFAFLKTVVPLLAMVVGTGWVIATKPLGTEMIGPMVLVIATALGVSKALDAFVSQRRRARLAKIRLGIPDMLELLVITSEAGLGPQPAMRRVASELQRTYPDLAYEILHMVSEIAMTNDRRTAYARLNSRVPLPEVSIFTQTLDQSDTYGTPFSQAMRTLIAEQRANRLMWIEEKAARLPVLMTLPLIFCIMPAVFVVLVGPAVLSVIDNILAGG